MSDDLVKRLRDLGDHTAADRIEELEAQLAGQDYDVHPVEMAARIKELEAALKLNQDLDEISVGVVAKQADRIKELEERHENMCNLWAKSEAGRQVLLGRVDDLEARLALAIDALDEAIYLLSPTQKDMEKRGGVYRIVSTVDELKGEVVTKCPPCNHDCNQGRECPARRK